MKRFASIFAALLVLGTGCEQSTGRPSGTPDGEEGQETTGNVITDYYRLQVWPGTSREFPILTEEEVSGSSLDESIATVSIKEDSYIISAHRPGITDITLSDGIHTDRKIQVLTIFDGIYDECFGAEIESERIIVTADDKETESAIRAEISASLSVFDYSKHVFDYDGYRFETTLATDSGEQEVTGSYTYDGTSASLLNDGDTEPVTYELVPEGIYILLKRDLTEHYRTLYPQAGVKEAKAVRILARMDRPDLQDEGNKEDISA